MGMWDMLFPGFTAVRPLRKVCKHCGIELPPAVRTNGRQKEFCSILCNRKYRYKLEHGKR